MAPQALRHGTAYASVRGGDDSRPTVGFALDDRTIIRTASAGKFAATSVLPTPANAWAAWRNGGADSAKLGRLWNLLQLDGGRPRVDRGPGRPTVGVVDMFCGCGGLSLGVKRAAEAVGARPMFLLAVDVAQAALRVYDRNLRPLRYARQNVRNLLDYSRASSRSVGAIDIGRVDAKKEIASTAGSVDIFLAGPPCQGNSNLNNKTRRVDRRNELYLDAVVAGIALGARVIIIENVPAVTHSHQNVISQSLQMLEHAGYGIGHNELMLTASDFGTPQERRRHFLIAGKSGRTVSMSDIDALKVSAPTVSEALRPLESIGGRTTFDRPSDLSTDNRKRVQFLIDSQTYDLPDDERPDCHRLKPHSYPAVYGRMRPNRVAPTITTGFLSPGRGRFAHPFQARSLTPHEGARLQGFGEDFDWLRDSEGITRGEYASMIGAAVPPQLGFVVGMCAISMLQVKD